MKSKKKKEKLHFKTKISTIYDRILDYVKRNKISKGSEIKKALNIPSKKFSRYIEVLEDAGLIEVEYPPVGDIKVKLKEVETSWLRK